MQDRELYQQILGLESPWSMSGVELDGEPEEIRVRVGHPRGAKFGCPDCDRELACHDHAAERRWRHLDSRQYKTVLIAGVPRVKCPEHGVKNAHKEDSEAYLAVGLLPGFYSMRLRVEGDKTSHDPAFTPEVTYRLTVPMAEAAVGAIATATAGIIE